MRRKKEKKGMSGKLYEVVCSMRDWLTQAVKTVSGRKRQPIVHHESPCCCCVDLPRFIAQR